MEIHGNQWKSMEIHGNPWKSMEISGNLWKSIEIYGNPWKSAESGRKSMESMNKANSGHDHAGSSGMSEANLSHDGSGDRDLAAKPESQSQNDHTNGGREDRGIKNTTAAWCIPHKSQDALSRSTG